MSPTRTIRGYYANLIARLLEKHAAGGKVLVECAVDTADGTKEADVVWVSDERFLLIKDEYSCPIAPEICVEILSRSNTLDEMLGKKDLYLKAGAIEYWLCTLGGEIQFFDASGSLPSSKLSPGFPAKLDS